MNGSGHRSHARPLRVAPDTRTTTPPTLTPTTRATTVVAVVGPLMVAWVVAVVAWGYEPADWSIVHGAGRALVSGDLAVYAHRPEAQVGPLALVLSALPRPVFVAMVCALFLGVTMTARRLGVSDLAVLLLGSAGSIVWSFSAISGHVDDQLVVLGAALMIIGIREQRHSAVGWGFVLALAGKPTGVVLAPLLLGLGWPTLLSAVGGVTALWVPFVLADAGGFLSAGKGIVLVAPWSTPFMLGEPAGAAFPAWVRPAQLVGGLLVCAVVARRNGPTAAVIAALAWRAFLEPGAWPSYSISLIVLAVLLLARQRLVAGLAIGSWLAGWLLIATPGIVSGAVHSGLLAGLVAVLLAGSARDSASQSLARPGLELPCATRGTPAVHRHETAGFQSRKAGVHLAHVGGLRRNLVGRSGL